MLHLFRRMEHTNSYGVSKDCPKNLYCMKSKSKKHFRTNSSREEGYLEESSRKLYSSVTRISPLIRHDLINYVVQVLKTYNVTTVALLCQPDAGPFNAFGTMCSSFQESFSQIPNLNILWRPISRGATIYFPEPLPPSTRGLASFTS